MTYYEEFKRRVELVGDDREYSLREAKREFEYMLAMMPNAESIELYDYDKNKIVTTVLVNDIRPVDDRIVDDKKFLFSPDVTVEHGYLMKYKNSWWICIVKETNTVDSHIATRFRPCNYLLKWMDDFGIIRQEWTVVSNKTLYSDGVRSTDLSVIPNQKMHVMFQLNENTRNLVRDKRLMILNDTYKITNIDRTIIGMTQFILTETQMNDNDNIELGIADYIQNPDLHIQLVSPSTYEILLTASNPVVIAKMFDGYGDEVPVDFNYTSSNTSVLDVDENGVLTLYQNGVSLVTISYDVLSVDVFVNVTVVPNIGESITIQGDSKITAGSSSIYTATIYRNNVYLNDTVIFSLINLSGLPLSTDIAVIENVNGNDCVIKVPLGATESFKLKAESQYDFNTFEIDIKTLFDF